MRLRAAAILATLAAGLAAGSADARPNDGRYAKSAEAAKKQKYDCGFAKTYYGNELGESQRLADKGYTAAALKHAQTAKDTRVEAKGAGCGWAA
jgi:hypothetical protein